MTRKLFVDIVITLALAIFLSWSALFSVNMAGLCPFYDCNTVRSYTLVAAIVVSITLFLFLEQQFSKTKERIKPKKRNLILDSKPFKSFQSAVKTIWEAGAPETEEDFAPYLQELGWELSYDNGTKVIIYQKQFYYWLLKVAKLQEDLQDAGKDRVKSPVSQREHHKLGREKLRIYKMLLDRVNAVEYVNGNVIRLKAECVTDPWSTVVVELNKILRCVEV